MAALPLPARERAAVDSREDIEHPCFVVEDRSGFQFLREAEVVEYCARMLEGGQPDEEGQYAILYTLETPHRPRVAGRDEMGALPHSHLEFDSLKRIVQSGRADPWAA